MSVQVCPHGYEVGHCPACKCGPTHHHACACREAAVAKLVEALERRLKTEESQAAMRAIASGLGVSEWPAFVSESFFDDCAALDEFHGRKA